MKPEKTKKKNQVGCTGEGERWKWNKSDEKVMWEPYCKKFSLEVMRTPYMHGLYACNMYAYMHVIWYRIGKNHVFLKREIMFKKMVNHCCFLLNTLFQLVFMMFLYAFVMFNVSKDGINHTVHFNLHH